jgi:rubrerythrin
MGRGGVMPAGQGRGSGIRGNARLQAGALTPLSAKEKTALRKAILDEYAAEQFYSRVLDKFGSVRMFENIRNAETRHAAALAALFDAYGINPPNRKKADVPEVPDNWQDVMKFAVQVERDNIAMYDDLMPNIDHDDIRAVFERLQYVSENRHLAALERGVPQPR